MATIPSMLRNFRVPNNYAIRLASKIKLRYVTRTVMRDASDAVKHEAWDTYNNMVSSWIIGSVIEPIKSPSCFITTHLKYGNNLKNYAVTNGSRK